MRKLAPQLVIDVIASGEFGGGRLGAIVVSEHAATSNVAIEDNEERLRVERSMATPSRKKLGANPYKQRALQD
jgi:hypothetical protein